MLTSKQRIVYMAGPLFTSAEQQFNRDVAKELRYHNVGVNLPQEFCKGLSAASDIMRMCRAAIDKSDIILVNCDGPDMDSGTAWEAGYAHAKGKRVIAYRTDFRRAGDCERNMNLMIGESADLFLKLYVPGESHTAILVAHNILHHVS